MGNFLQFLANFKEANMETQSTNAAESFVSTGLEGSSEGTQTFEAKINSLVSQMTKDESGKWSLPDIEMSEAEKFAVNAERRRRDTESALSKTRLQLKANEKVANKLKSKVGSLLKPVLSEEVKAELENLKYTDPETWHVRMTELEQNVTATLDEEYSNLTSEASQQALIERRKELLDEYNRNNPNAKITDSVVQNELPPKLVKSLEDGSIAFEDFIVKANKFLTTSKKLGGIVAEETPNLNMGTGGSRPSFDSMQKSEQKSYRETVF